MQKLETRFNISVQAIAFGLIMAVITLLFRGYVFPHTNHGQEIPPVLALLNPQLFQNDIAVQSFLLPGPRFVYEYIVTGLTVATGFHVSAIIFILNVAAHISFFAALLFISGALLSKVPDDKVDRGAQFFLASCLSIGVIIEFSSWGSQVISSSGIPSTFAMALAPWGIYFALREGWIKAYLFLALATLLQFLVGFLLGATLLPALALSLYRTRRVSVGLAAIGLWLGAALAIYIPMALAARPTPPDFDFLRIFGLYRVPHHWVPSTASPLLWLSDLALVFTSIVAFFLLPKDTPRQTATAMTLLGMVLVSVACVILNYVFVEIYPIELIGKLQFQRIMPFGHFAILCLILTLFAPRTLEISFSWRNLVRFGVLFAFIPIAVLSAFGKGTDTLRLLFLVYAIGLTAISFSISSRLRGLLVAAMTAGAAATLLVVFILPPLLGPSKIMSRIQTRYAINNSDHLEGKKISDWLRTQTPVDAIFLTVPYSGIFEDTLQFRSERSAYATFKNVPYDNYSTYVWSERIKALINHSLDPFMPVSAHVQLWEQRTAGDIAAIAHANGVCYIVDIESVHPDFPGKILVTEQIQGQTWALWQLNDCT